MKSIEKIKEEIKAARNQVEGLKQVLSDRKKYYERVIAPYARLDKTTGFITAKGQLDPEIQEAANCYKVILRTEKAIDSDPAVILLGRQEQALDETNKRIMKDASKNARFLERKYKQQVERFKKSSLNLAFFEREERYVKNDSDFGDGKVVYNVTKHESGAVAKLAAKKGKIAMATLWVAGIGAVAAIIIAGVKFGPAAIKAMGNKTPKKPTTTDANDVKNDQKQYITFEGSTYELVTGSFTNVNNVAEVESVIDEAMASLGDFASEANITREDMKNIIMALNAPYVANPDQITDDLRTDVNEKLFNLYKVYLGSNDTRLFGISDGKKNGPHNFELSKLFVASTPNLGLMQEFDQNLNFILDADEVTPEVTEKASTLYARAAYQTGAALSDTPIIDENEEQNYGLMYAYSLACNTVYPIFEPCGAGFTTREGYVYSSKSNEDIVYERVADQLNRSGMKLQSYIKGNCKTLK